MCNVSQLNSLNCTSVQLKIGLYRYCWLVVIKNHHHHCFASLDETNSLWALRASKTHFHSQADYKKAMTTDIKVQSAAECYFFFPLFFLPPLVLPLEAAVCCCDTTPWLRVLSFGIVSPRYSSNEWPKQSKRQSTTRMSPIQMKYWLCHVFCVPIKVA